MHTSDQGDGQPEGLGTHSSSIATSLAHACHVSFAEALSYKYVIKTDIWSLGITMIEMLTHGGDPWPGESPTNVAIAVRDQRKIPRVPDGTPPELEIVMKYVHRCAVLFCSSSSFFLRLFFRFNTYKCACVVTCLIFVCLIFR